MPMLSYRLYPHLRIPASNFVYCDWLGGVTEYKSDVSNQHIVHRCISCRQVIRGDLFAQPKMDRICDIIDTSDLMS